MTKKLQAFTIGNAVVDTFLVSTTFNPYSLQHNFKHSIKEQFKSIGGGALNAASAYAQLGFEAYPICPIGNKSDADFITEQSKAKRIDTSLLIQKNTHSHQSTIISIAKQEEPLVFSYKNKALFLEEAEIPTTQLQSADLLYISSFEVENLPAVHKAIAHTPEHATIAFNPNPNLIQQKPAQFELIADKSDLLFLNQYEAELYMSIKGESWNLHTFFSMLNNQGSKTVVLTLGRNGAHIFHEGKFILIQV